MQTWIFQGNPDEYDIDGYLASRPAQVVCTVPAPSGGSYTRRACAFLAMKWRTRGTASIRQAEAPSDIGSVDPETSMAQAPTSSDAWPAA